MLLWVLCSLLGVFTVAFSPMLIGIVIKLLSGYARKYPDLTETIAIITSLIVGGVMLGMAGIFAAVYHHLITGKP